MPPPEGENVLNRGANLHRLNAQKAVRSTLSAPRKAAAPGGEAHDYFLDRVENVYNLSDFERADRMTIYFDGDSVYIPNCMSLLYLDTPDSTYIVGTLSEDKKTITIDPDQAVGTYYGMKVCIGQIDENGYLLDTPITLTYDQATGFITNNDESSLIITYLPDYGSILGITYYLTFIPGENFTKIERPLTGSGETLNPYSYTMDPITVNSTVEDYYSAALGIHFVKGLYDIYPDSYIIMSDDAEGNALLGAQVIADDEAILLTDDLDGGTIYLDFMSTFVFDAAEDTYTQKEGETIMNGFGGSTPGTISYNTTYTGLRMGAPTATGISRITASGTEKDAVSTEYYDLSGRRVSGAVKGVSIRKMKFADGTSKSVKVLK